MSSHGFELVFWKRSGKQHAVGLINESNVIGRGDTCDVIVTDAYASREHARIIVNENIVHLEDLKSINGTWVNDYALEYGDRLQIQVGDIITVGETVMSLNDTQAKTVILGNPRAYRQIEQVPSRLSDMVDLEKPSAVKTQSFEMVFISHAKEDDDKVNNFVDILKRKTTFLRIWVDHHALSPDDNRAMAVETALEQATYMIVVLTSVSLESPEVRNEWNFFVDKHKPVFPIKLDECEVPSQLKLYQFVSLTDGDFEEGVDNLIRKLRMQTVSSKSSTTFHLAECDLVNHEDKRDLISYRSFDVALGKGLKPCIKCLGWLEQSD